MPTQYVTQQDLRNLYPEGIRSATSSCIALSDYADSTSSGMTLSGYIDNATREVEKLINLLYQSIGVNPYDEYGNLRPDEDILSDLVAANLKIDISIDDIIGG